MGCISIRRGASWITAGAVAISLVITGCGSSETSKQPASTKTEQTVCARLQDMISALADQRQVDAVTAYDAMLAWANEAPADDPSPVITAARRMGEITDERVDESKLLASEVTDLANSAMTASGDQMTKLLAGCEAIGAPITGVKDAGATQ